MKIFCDFDGTITKRDLSIAILDRFAEGWRNLPISVAKGTGGSKQLYSSIKIKAGLKEIEKFVDGVINFEDGFEDFVKNVGKDFIVVSDGFDIYLKKSFEKIGLNLDSFSVAVEERDGEVYFSFPYSVDFCNLCATCKLNILRERKDDFTVFIGNGISDRCAVEEADLVFAKIGEKNFISEVLMQKSKTFFTFKNFNDIIKVFKKNPKVFIIDFDGTLVWSYDGIIFAFKETFKKMRKKMPKNIRNFIGLPLKEIFLMVLKDEKEAEEGVKTFREIYSQIFLRKTKPAVGSKETLRELKNMGYKLAILSNKKVNFVERICAEFGFDVDIIMGEDGETPLKPSSYPVRKILQNFNACEKDAFIVGDTLIDYETSRNSGVDFILLYNPYTDPQEFETPTAFIPSISQLKKIAKFFLLK